MEVPQFKTFEYSGNLHVACRQQQEQIVELQSWIAKLSVQVNALIAATDPNTKPPPAGQMRKAG